MRMKILGRVTFAVLTMLMAAPAAQSQTFYAGKNIEIWIGAGTGGGYDINARLVARYMPAYIPEIGRAHV